MEASLANQLVNIMMQLIRYELPFVLAFGTVTNLLNIMVFSQRILRKNVCSWYFILLSLLQILLLTIFCMQTIIATWTGYNVVAHVLSFCKIRQYLFDLVTSLSRHVLCLISIDRWMVTSSHASLRQKSSPRVACWLIISGIMFWSIFNIHSLIRFSIVFNTCTTSTASIYFFFYSIYTIIISIVPMIIMSVFSVLTLRNLRTRRVIPVFQAHLVRTRSAARRRYQRDLLLIRLSVVQVVAFLVFNSGWCVYPLYLFITSSRGNRTLEERLMSAFLVSIGFNLLYTYAALTFVLYTLASAQFRKECRASLKQFLHTLQNRLAMLH